MSRPFVHQYGSAFYDPPYYNPSAPEALWRVDPYTAKMDNLWPPPALSDAAPGTSDSTWLVGLGVAGLAVGILWGMSSKRSSLGGWRRRRARRRGRR